MRRKSLSGALNQAYALYALSQVLGWAADYINEHAASQDRHHGIARSALAKSRRAIALQIGGPQCFLLHRSVQSAPRFIDE